MLWDDGDDENATAIGGGPVGVVNGADANNAGIFFIHEHEHGHGHESHVLRFPQPRSIPIRVFGRKR